MNKQAILDQVIRFLYAQGGPGQQANGCFYRTADGLKSALGCLISDDLYSESLEDRDPADLPPNIFAALNAETDQDVEFLVALETAHDRAAVTSRGRQDQFWHAWIDALQPVVAEHALSLKILDALGAPETRKSRDNRRATLARLGNRPLKWQP